jgi:hypothetical protein
MRTDKTFYCQVCEKHCRIIYEEPSGPMIRAVVKHLPCGTGIAVVVPNRPIEFYETGDDGAFRPSQSFKLDDGLDDGFKMTFTAVRDGGGNEVTGVQMFVQRYKESWTSRLLSPGEFAELILSSHVFPPAEADSLFSRVREQGQITNENVPLNDSQMQFLGLKHVQRQ